MDEPAGPIDFSAIASEASSSPSPPRSPGPAGAAGQARLADRAAPWMVAAGGAVLVLAAAVLPLLRQARIRSWQTIWAEDGFVYGHDAVTAGPARVLLRGYAGYLQLLPRLLAIPARWLPVRVWPVYFAIAATTTVALLAWFCYWAADGWIASRPVRLALAALVALMPAMVAENTANITNTIWAISAVTPWALVSTRERTRDVVVRSLVAFLAATATPLTIVFLPVALGWAALRRTRAALTVAAAFVVGVALQLLVVTHTRTKTAAVLNVVGDLLKLLASRVFTVFLVGTRGLTSFGSAGTALVWIVLPAVVLVLFVLLIPGARRRSLALALVFVAEAIVVFVVPVWGRGTISLGIVGQFKGLPGMRFSVIPVFLLASAFAVLVTADGPVAGRLAERIGRPVFIAQVVVTIVLCFSAVNLRSSGPVWSTSVERTYRTECGGRPSERLATLRPSVYPSWTFRLPCRLLAP